MNMRGINMCADYISVVPISKSFCKLTAQSIGFLWGYFSRAKGLPKVVCNYIIVPTDFSCVANILLLGIEEFRICNAAVTLPTSD